MDDVIQVIHVDDEQPLLDLVAEIIERTNQAISVRSVTTPGAVPTLLANQPVDCVVSDYEMPSCNGIELCERIREDHPDMPFFLLTSRDEPALWEAANSAGVTAYIRKKPGIEHYKRLAREIVAAVDNPIGQRSPAPNR